MKTHNGSGWPVALAIVAMGLVGCIAETSGHGGDAPDKVAKQESLQLGKADHSVPDDWTCVDGYYDSADGCDCGCGVPDPDCDSSDASACEYRYCSGDTPEVDDSRNHLCVEATGSSVPAEWSCAQGYYGTADGCDCGCGVRDPDCDSSDASACEYEYCGGDTPLVDEDDNHLCASDEDEPAPSGWTCTDTYYGSDDGCDCGCGVRDPDCDSSSRSVCEYQHCRYDEDVSSDANWRCVPDSGDGGGSADECDEINDCGVGEMCRYSIAECDTSTDPLFSVSRCESHYPPGEHQQVDCTRSDCLGSVDCGVGETCGTERTWDDKTIRTCQPDPHWDGPGVS